jgi:hypothetical protein
MVDALRLTPSGRRFVIVPHEPMNLSKNALRVLEGDIFGAIVRP